MAMAYVTSLRVWSLNCRENCCSLIQALCNMWPLILFVTHSEGRHYNSLPVIAWHSPYSFLYISRHKFADVKQFLFFRAATKINQLMQRPLKLLRRFDQKM